MACTTSSYGSFEIENACSGCWPLLTVSTSSNKYLGQSYMWMSSSLNFCLESQICFRVLHETICDSKAGFPFLRASSDGLCTPSICIFRYGREMNSALVNPWQFFPLFYVTRNFSRNACLRWLGLVSSADDALSCFHSSWLGSWSALDIDGRYVFRAIWVEKFWSSLQHTQVWELLEFPHSFQICITCHNEFWNIVTLAPLITASRPLLVPTSSLWNSLAIFTTSKFHLFKLQLQQLEKFWPGLKNVLVRSVSGQYWLLSIVC